MSNLKELFEIQLNENDEDERQRERQAQQQDQTRTQTRTADPEMAPDMSAFQRDMDAKEQGTANVPQKKRWGNLPSLRQASAAATRQATANVGLPAEAGEKLSFLQSLGLEDEISDEQAMAIAGRDADQDVDMAVGRPEPQTLGTDVATIETLPDVINKEVAKHAPVEPDWHQVKHLPGYVKGAIRAMGRQVFGVFTKTKIEDIQVIANLGGSGPNTEREINAVAGWLKDNGTRDTDGEMNFNQSIPDYDAEFKMYSAENFTFMIVQDDYGNYVYSWPTADNKYGQPERSAPRIK